MRLFLKDADFQAFERIIEQTLETRPMRIVSYCLMSNHWHFMLWPENEGNHADGQGQASWRAPADGWCSTLA
jgi:putative transposase